MAAESKAILRARLRALERAVHQRAIALTRNMASDECKRKHDKRVRKARAALLPYLNTRKRG